MRRALASILGGLALALGPAAASAATPTLIPGSGGQHTLAVRVAERAVEAKACAGSAGCTAAGGTRFELPPGADAAKAQIDPIRLRGDKAVAQVRVPLGDGAAGVWTLLLAATVAPDLPAVDVKLKPAVLDKPEGLEGEQKRTLLVREPDGGGERILLGTRYENASVCGRPSLMQVRALDPDDLLWNPADTRALGEAEMQRAPRLRATRSDGPFAAASPQLLHGVLASSALGHSRASLTDRDLASAWTEHKKSAGSGEFLVMTASEEVPVTGFEIVVKPTVAVARGAAPKSFYIATRHQVFAVDMPDDAWAGEPGQSYRVALPEPVASDCFAVIFDDGHVKGDADRVTLTELRATTRFDGADLPALVAALDRDADAGAARALLSRSGEAGAAAAIAGYPSLGREGQRRALEVIEGGACDTIAPFFVDRVLGKGAGADFDPVLDPTARMARERLRVCKAAAGDALAAAVRQSAPGTERVWAGAELALLSPKTAIDVILEVLEEGSTAPRASGARDEVRRGLRAALAGAVKHPRAREVVGAKLEPAAFGALSLVERIDLLRAIGEALPQFSGAPAALRSLLEGDASFRTRYLLLEPAAHLARAGDRAALDYLKSSLHRRDEPQLRARATRLASGVAGLASELRGALDDPHPRVREAAVAAVAEDPKLQRTLETTLVRLLARDPWTFVRVGAAEGLARGSTSEQGDQALVEVVADREGAPRLRSAALRALGKRKSSRAAGEVRDVADNPKESVPIRVAAIAALGDMCDRDATDLLYKLAIRAGYQQIPYDQPLGLAALSALGELKPPDLHQKLAPLFVRNKIVPPQVRAIAQNVLEQPGRCR